MSVHHVLPVALYYVTDVFSASQQSFSYSFLSHHLLVLQQVISEELVYGPKFYLSASYNFFCCLETWKIT